MDACCRIILSMGVPLMGCENPFYSVGILKWRDCAVFIKTKNKLLISVRRVAEYKIRNTIL